MKSRPIKEQRLDALESAFRPLLLACLEECASGRWGLFGQNEQASRKYLTWEEADRLKEIAIEIQTLRAEFGQPNELVERFLQCCTLRGTNTPGEPKLAMAFLAEVRDQGPA